MRFSPKSPLASGLTALSVSVVCFAIEVAIRRAAHRRRMRALEHPSVQAMVDNIRAAQMTSQD